MSDFETTTDPSDCRVWSWGVTAIDDDSVFDRGTDIQSFIDYISGFKSICYFHNLAFDAGFILDFLFQHGFTHTEERYPKEREFTSLISGLGKWFQIRVNWGNGYTIFKDSLKKIPLRVDQIPEAYGLDDAKGSIDYDAPRPVGYQPTADEWEYLRHDLTIVAAALRQQFSEGMKGLTVASDSLRDYTELLGRNKFESIFPTLPLPVDNIIRDGYRGGFAYANPRYSGRVVGSGTVYDINSMYPYVMRTKPMPYGEPYYFDTAPIDDPEWPLYIVTVMLTAKLKPRHIPTIQIKRNPGFVDTEYVEAIDEPTELTLTNIDLELMREHYDVDIYTWEGGVQFRARTGLFNAYIDKWMAIKSNPETPKGLRTIAKLHLNSLYGKFATNPHIRPKVPKFENNQVVLRYGTESTRDPVYTAVGVFITSYARQLVTTEAQRHYDLFLYCDTDSLHLLDGEHNLYTHPTELGAWKKEYSFTRAIFARAKAYCENKRDEDCKHEDKKRGVPRCEPGQCYETHIAGLPEKVAELVTIDDFYNGKTFKGKLVSRRVPGGVTLVEEEYALRF